MPEIAYTQAFFWFHRLFMEIGPWLIFGILATGAIYIFGWGSGYQTRIKEELKSNGSAISNWLENDQKCLSGDGLLPSNPIIFDKKERTCQKS